MGKKNDSGGESEEDYKKKDKKDKKSKAKDSGAESEGEEKKEKKDKKDKDKKEKKHKDEESEGEGEKKKKDKKKKDDDDEDEGKDKKKKDKKKKDEDEDEGEDKHKKDKKDKDKKDKDKKDKDKDDHEKKDKHKDLDDEIKKKSKEVEKEIKDVKKDVKDVEKDVKKEVKDVEKDVKKEVKDVEKKVDHITDKADKITLDSKDVSKAVSKAIKYATSVDWLDDARKRSEDFKVSGPKSPTTWVLGEVGAISRDAIIAGQDVDGTPLYVARAFHEGGLHIGKASAKGASIAVGGVEIPVSAFEVLLGDSRAVRWISQATRPADVRPVEGGFDPSGKAILIGQAKVGAGVFPAKVLGWLETAMVTLNGVVSEVKDYNVLVYS